MRCGTSEVSLQQVKSCSLALINQWGESNVVPQSVRTKMTPNRNNTSRLWTAEKPPKCTTHTHTHAPTTNLAHETFLRNGSLHLPSGLGVPFNVFVLVRYNYLPITGCYSIGFSSTQPRFRGQPSTLDSSCSHSGATSTLLLLCATLLTDQRSCCPNLVPQDVADD